MKEAVLLEWTMPLPAHERMRAHEFQKARALHPFYVKWMLALGAASLLAVHHWAPQEFRGVLLRVAMAAPLLPAYVGLRLLADLRRPGRYRIAARGIGLARGTLRAFLPWFRVEPANIEADPEFASVRCLALAVRRSREPWKLYFSQDDVSEAELHTILDRYITGKVQIW